MIIVNTPKILNLATLRYQTPNEQHQHVLGSAISRLVLPMICLIWLINHLHPKGQVMYNLVASDTTLQVMIMILIIPLLLFMTLTTIKLCRVVVFHLCCCRVTQVGWLAQLKVAAGARASILYQTHFMHWQMMWITVIVILMLSTMLSMMMIIIITQIIIQALPKINRTSLYVNNHYKVVCRNDLAHLLYGLL